MAETLAAMAARRRIAQTCEQLRHELYDDRPDIETQAAAYIGSLYADVCAILNIQNISMSRADIADLRLIASRLNSKAAEAEGMLQ